MKEYMCQTIERRVVSITVDAENEQEAADKALRKFIDGDSQVEVLPGEEDYDTEIEVTLLNEEGYITGDFKLIEAHELQH